MSGLGLLSADFQLLEKTVAFSGSGNPQCCIRDPTRWALIFSYTANPNGRAFVSTNPNLTPNSGLLLAGATVPLMFNFRDYGALVTEPWFANGTTGESITVIEIYYRPSE